MAKTCEHCSVLKMEMESAGTEADALKQDHQHAWWKERNYVQLGPSPSGSPNHKRILASRFSLRRKNGGTRLLRSTKPIVLPILKRSPQISRRASRACEVSHGSR